MVTRAPLVVHIVHSLGAGGLENGLVNLINRTPQGRYRHAIICLARSGSFAERIRVPGVEIFELNKREGKDLAVYWRLWKLLRKLRPNVVHTRNLAALDSLIVARLVPGTKTVHGEHGRDIYDLDGRNRKYVLLRKLMRRFVDRYITVSKDLYQWLVSEIGVRSARIDQIYNGVDLLKFAPDGPIVVEKNGAFIPPSADRVVLGTVGRLAPVKNQELLVRAFDTLNRRGIQPHREISLLIVGDGPQTEYLTAVINDLYLQDLVYLTGDRDDIPELLRTMDIFVLPSLAEGISNTLLEAMATGLPLIATNVGGNPELVRDKVNGFLVPSADVEAMADAMESLVSNYELRTRMGAAGRELVSEKFSWTTTVEAYLAVYDAVTDPGNRISADQENGLGEAG